MSELISDLPTALKNHASWLVNAGGEDTKQKLSMMEGTPDDIRILKAAIATEKGRLARSSRLLPMEAKLRKFEKVGPIAAGNSQLSTVDSQPVEIVTASEVDAAQLHGLATEITAKIELITGHEGAFEEATLEHRLEIGLHIAKAQEIFTLSDPGKRNPTGQNQHSSEALSTVDKGSPPPAISPGFVTWLGKHIPLLKRPTAYRYATAFRALDLPLTAKPADIRATLKTLRHQAGKANLPMPTLAALVKAAPKPSKPEALTVVVPKTSKQLKLEDARETFHLWMAAFDKAIKQGHLDHLDKPGLIQLNDFTAAVRDRIKARLK